MKPVPVYVTPERIIVGTLVTGLELIALGALAAGAVARVTYRVLNDHPLYGPIKEKA